MKIVCNPVVYVIKSQHEGIYKIGCTACAMYKVGETHSCYSCLYADDNIISSEPLEPEILARYR